MYVDMSAPWILWVITPPFFSEITCPRAWNDQHDSPKSDEGSKDGEPGHQQKSGSLPPKKNLLYKRDKLN